METWLPSDPLRAAVLLDRAMSSPDHPPTGIRRAGLRWAAGLVVVGVLAIVTYALLAVTTSVGDDGDIGGGLILLLGYLLTGAGIVTGIVILVVERKK